MLVETADQYLDIFQRLKDEVSSREMPPGYYDLDQMNGRHSVDIDLDSGRSSLSQEENEFIYREDSDQEGDVGVVAYYTDIAANEDRKDVHDSTNTANYTVQNRSQRQPEGKRIRSLALD